MTKTTMVGAFTAPLLMLAMALPVYADSTCKDGTTSTVSGRGACSGHGGVQKAAKPTAATASAPATPTAATPAPAAAAPMAAAPAATTAAKSAPTAAAGNTDPTGATAKCKDGTYSKAKSHTGACSRHGGVAEWITPG